MPFLENLTELGGRLIPAMKGMPPRNFIGYKFPI
ncbi:hypothetical protein T06_148 [Trichinella sp. T6]|nr:hypothetical protein T06_148 [Trichinella sp. T6]